MKLLIVILFSNVDFVMYLILAADYICTCQQTDNDMPIIVLSCDGPRNNTCRAKFACFSEHVYRNNIFSVRQGCYHNVRGFGPLFCSTNNSHITTVCCTSSIEECNKNLFPSYPSLYLMAMNSTEGGKSSNS